MVQFSSSSVSAPSVLVAGSSDAVRLEARLVLNVADTPAMLSPEECAARQEAYRQQRAAWRREVGQAAAEVEKG
jgi:hypothetical protein